MHALMKIILPAFILGYFSLCSMGARCPDGWAAAPNGVQCFSFPDEKYTWQEGRELCNKMRSNDLGVDLVSILSKETNNFLVSRLPKEDTDYWTGLIDESRQENWFWVNYHKPLKGFTNWRKRDRSDIYKPERVGVTIDSSTGKWDVSDTFLDSHYVICEIYDVDECKQKNGKCGHLCINTMGSFNCLCPVGYRLNQSKCEEINYCLESTGDCSHSCKKIHNTNICVCPPGFKFDKNVCMHKRFWVGPVAGNILLLLLVCIGVTYFFKKKQSNAEQDEQIEPSLPPENTEPVNETNKSETTDDKDQGAENDKSDINDEARTEENENTEN